MKEWCKRKEVGLFRNLELVNLWDSSKIWDRIVCIAGQDQKMC